MFEQLQALENSVGPASPGGVAEALALSEMADARQAAASGREAESRRADAEARMEALALADRMLGGPLAEMSRARSDLMTLNDEVSDLKSRLDKVTARRDRAEENLRFWGERLAIAEEASSRSAPSRLDPAEAAVQRARMALDDARREGRAVVERARSRQQRYWQSFRSNSESEGLRYR